MRVAVLGANGFIGRNLVPGLILEGHDVVSFVRKKVTEIGAPVGEQVVFDFFNLKKVGSLLCTFDLVIHLASSSNPSSSSRNARIDAEQNILGSLDLMEILKDSPGTKLVFVSSGGAVYGSPEALPISESHATNPISFYGVTKLAIEKYLYAYNKSYGLDYTVLRLSNPFGPYQINTKGQGIVSTIIESALLNQELQIWGDGRNIRDYLFVGDAVEALLKGVSYVGEERLFNIGSGVGTTLIELLEVVGEITNKSIEVDFLPARPFDSPANVLDISQARSSLFWGPSTSLRDGLEKTVAWNRIRLGL